MTDDLPGVLIAWRDSVLPFVAAYKIKHRAVIVSGGEITLYEWVNLERRAAHFESVGMACLAVTSGTIVWTLKPAEKRENRRKAAKTKPPSSAEPFWRHAPADSDA